MTGIIVSTPPTTSLPPSNASNNPVGLPGVTYQYALLNLPQTWGAKQTFPLGNISLNAADITGTLPFGVLPFPSPSTLGGIQSASPVAHNWINSISTSGVPSLSQPAFSDISGTVTASQLPNPTASTLGGIESIAAVSHKWINTISTTGVPTQTQPDAVDVSFTQTGTGAVATNLSSKTSQIISVLDFGAVGNGVTDDRLAIQAAINATPSGGTLCFPPTANGYAVSQANVTYCLLISNPIKLMGLGSASAIRPLASVASTVTTLYFLGSAQGLIFPTVIDGIFIGDPSSGTRFGLHGIVFDTLATGAMFQNNIVRNCYIVPSTAGFGIFAINGAGNINGGMVASHLHNNQIGGGVSLNLVGDSIRITDNVVYGNNNIYANLIANAGNLQILGNNLQTVAGQIVLDQTQSCQIAFNEIEQNFTNTEANNSMIDLLGTTSTLKGVQIISNQMQPIASVGNPIIVRVANAAGTVIEANRLTLPASYVPIVITASATATAIGALNSVSGASSILTDSGSGTIKAGQILGTATNDNATAGNVGEPIESEILVGAAVSCASGIAKDITSISLTAGDWDVWGTVATNPAGSTTSSLVSGWVSTVSATLPAVPNKGAQSQFPYAAPAGFGVFAPVGRRRLSLSATTTVFLSTIVVFATSTMSAYGYIGARRAR